MNDIEAKVRCLEVAASLARPANIYTPEGVVEIARQLYTFVNASPEPEKEQEKVDKPKRGKQAQPDILS